MGWRPDRDRSRGREEALIEWGDYGGGYANLEILPNATHDLLSCLNVARQKQYEPWGVTTQAQALSSPRIMQPALRLVFTFMVSPPFVS